MAKQLTSEPGEVRSSGLPVLSSEHLAELSDPENSYWDLGPY